MKLAEVLKLYPNVRQTGRTDLKVLKVFTDSRDFHSQSLFVAVKGFSNDGHDFLPEVCEKGAIGVIVENIENIPQNYAGAVIQVENARVALSTLAHHFFGKPSENLKCIGVTGTNGKTSVTYLIEKILEQANIPTAVMGTIDHHFQKQSFPSVLTTPDPLTLQSRLNQFLAMGAKAVAFEVSSHALAQGRADGIPFDAAVFTNLTRDHLDFHQTMEEYFQAKSRLFTDVLGLTSKANAVAVINGDDPWGLKIKVSAKAKRWLYGLAPCDFHITPKSSDFLRSVFQLKTPFGKSEIELPCVGSHNVYNATAAVAASLAVGATLTDCERSLAGFTGVPGRLERVPNTKGIHVFIDYAHTDDALRQVLSALKKVKESSQSRGQIVTVFGCGGDRDKGKRPLMARAAFEFSDAIWITSDNPRTEDPMGIINECAKGIPSDKEGKTIRLEVDRKRAIKTALQSCQEGDVLLIAGKGHEKYQMIGTEKIPFSDFNVVRESLE